VQVDRESNLLSLRDRSLTYGDSIFDNSFVPTLIQ